METIYQILISAASVASLTIYLSLVSRWHGGGFVGGSPKQLKNFAWSWPFGLLAGLVWYEGRYPAVNIAWKIDQYWNTGLQFETIVLLICVFVGVVVTLLSMLGKTLGHGGGMDLGHNPKEPGQGREPEKLEYLILWLHPILPRYWYDVLLMVIVGLFSTLGASLAIGAVFLPSGALIAIGGLLKAKGYMIGWDLLPDGSDEEDEFFDEIDEATEIGEALTGAFAGFFLGLAFVLFRALLSY